MADLLIRFVIGGLVVSVFAIIGDMLKPKTFAGLFGAAPSVALATLSLTCFRQGSHYAATEARSMMLGALAFIVYASAIAILMMRFRPSVLVTCVIVLPAWFVIALGLWRIILA
jgi:uncharacterized membrane protein (GlpM family)